MSLCAFVRVAAVMGIAGSAQAALPIWGGPVYTPALGGVTSQDQSRLEGISGVSDKGVTIGNGSYYNANDQWLGSRAFRYSPGTPVSILGSLGTNSNGITQGGIYSVNRHGVVVGNRQKFDQAHNEKGNVPIRYSAVSITATELGTLGTNASGEASGSALDVNDEGLAVGSSIKYNAAHASLGYRAVRWSANSTSPTEMQVLGTSAGGGTFASAYAVNNAGQSTGRVTKYVNNVAMGDRAVRWSPSGIVNELGVISSYNGKADHEGHDINDAGAVIGEGMRYSANGTELGVRAVLWQANSNVAIELGLLGTTPGGATESRAIHINSMGTIVGYAYRYNAQGVGQGVSAVKWSTSNTAAVELPALGTGDFASAHARDVNDLNYVVGGSYTNDGHYHAVYWTPNGQVTNLNALLDPNSGYELIEALSITETGFVSGTARFDPDGPGGQMFYDRVFSMLVPDAGTYGRGDVNFDRKVDFDDLLQLAQHYGHPNAGISVHVGDLNLDGMTNFDDLLRLAQSYGTSALTDANALDAAFVSDWTLARSMVPEPAAGFLILFGLSARRQR